MPNLTTWIAQGRAVSNAGLIAIKPSSIAIRRGTTTLPAQTVRLETLASQREVVAPGGITHLIDAMLLGYRNHPTVADTDIQVGDHFTTDDTHYETVMIMPAHVDCIQVYLKVRA